MGDSRPSKKRKIEPANTFGNEKLQHTFRTGHLFVIHLTREILANGQESYFHQSLKNFMKILKQKLGQNRPDWMGLVLCNVKSDDAVDNIYVIQKFEEVSVNMFTTVMGAYEDDVNNYLNRISPANCSMADVLQQASRQFGTDTPTMTIKQIILLTCIDNPAPDSPDELHRIRQCADNYKALKIKLQVVGFSEEWNYERFYKEIEMLSEKSGARCFRKIQLDELEAEISRRAHVVANLDFNIAENAKVKVAIQNFISQRRPMTQADMSTLTNETLDRVNCWAYIDTSYLCDEDDAAEEFVFDIEKFPEKSSVMANLDCGDKTLLLSGVKVNTMRKSRERGIDLIGFKRLPEDDPIKHHIGSTLFVGCHCTATDPQTQFFSALLAKMVAKKVMAICAVTLRNFVSTLLWMMWPCEEYGGFYLHRIPFKEDVRDKVVHVANEYVHDNGELPLTDEQLTVMKKIVKYVRLNENPIEICDPHLERERVIVESLALDLERNELPVDGTLPYPEMAERLNRRTENRPSLIDQFGDAFPEIVGRPGTARMQVQELDLAVANDIVRDGTYVSYAVDKLKAVLRALGQPTAGKKADLITRINEYKRNSV